MKRFSVIALMLLLVVAFSLPASASATTNPGIKPGSFFYFFDTTFEKIGLFFTFSPEKKAEKALEYADERLAEAEAVTDNAQAVKTAITNYESNIAFAEEKSKDVGDKEKAEALLTSIADNTSKHQEVLTAVLVKVPDEAKEAITRAIEASRKGHEEAMQKIAELKDEIEQLKQEVAELKAKDEEREKTIEELSRQKMASPAAQQKVPTTQAPATPTSKQEIVQPQVSPKPEPAKTTNIITLPNGDVVEMDASGNIIRSIKEAPSNAATKISEELTRSNELLEEQNKILQQQTQAIQQIQTNTTPAPVPTPTPQPAPRQPLKELFIGSNGDCTYAGASFPRCKLEIRYSEDRQVKEPTNFTISTNDNGKFIDCVDCGGGGSQSTGNPLSANPILYGGWIRLVYFPDSEGVGTKLQCSTRNGVPVDCINRNEFSRTITVSANGISTNKTISFWYATSISQ